MTSRLISRIFLSFITLTLIISAVYRQEIYRFYKVVTLFNEGVIAENFQTMSEIFPHKVINKGEQNFKFGISDLKIINQFEYNGQQMKVEDHLSNTYTTGFLVVKDDKIAYEDYWLGHSKDGLHISWSVNKSFVSALIGIAIEEGHIKSINDAVSDYVPLLKGTGYDGIPLKDVLQMSTGVRFNEDYAAFFSDINRMGRVIALGSSINEFAASLESEKASGQYHHYVSMDTQVLGMVLKEATGIAPAQYLEDKIWHKLGMRSNAKWLTDDYGMELVFGTINVTMRDYARFGRLYMRYGDWQGEQIVPKQWVIDSITPDEPHLMPGKNPLSSSIFGYGYQWWIPNEPQGDFMARGVYGQYIYINPEKNVIIVKNSADPFWRSGGEESLITIKMFQQIANSL